MRKSCMSPRQTLTTLLLLVGIALLPSPLRAQWYNVRGTIYEHATLQPLPGANVAVADSTGKIVAGRQSQDNGQFMIPGVPTGNYTLKVSFMGFKPQSFALQLTGKGGNKKVQDILMREDATLLAETVIEVDAKETDAIDRVTVDKTVATYTDLWGRRLQGRPARKGIYIRGRRKEIVR